MENKYTNRYVLETGIGLQDVDHLENSSYFVQESERYLRGEISLDELDAIVSSYYKSKPAIDDRSAEADIVSIRIAKIISEDFFTLLGDIERNFVVFGEGGELFGEKIFGKSEEIVALCGF